MIYVNVTAIVVAAISNMILGYVWFTVIFGKTWPKLAGLSEDQLNKGVTNKVAVYSLQFLGALLMAFVLAHSLEIATHHLTSGTSTWESVFAAIEGSFSIWAGFIVPVTLGAVLWQNKSLKLWIINSAFYLISILVMSLMLVAWSL